MLRQLTFGTTRQGRFPRVCAEVQPDGFIWVVLCRTRREYQGTRDEFGFVAKPVHFSVSPRTAGMLVDALRKAIPVGIKERRARNRRVLKSRKAGK